MSESPTSPIRTFIDNIVRVLKANSGMFLSSVLVVVLFLMWMGDVISGARAIDPMAAQQGNIPYADAAFYAGYLELAGLWLMISAVLALDAVPRINKSFNGAEGMLWWNRWAMGAGYFTVLFGALLGWGLDGFAHTPAREVSDIVLLVMVVLLAVVMVLRYLGPNTAGRSITPLRKLMERIPFDVIYPAFMVVLIPTWGVVAWHVWEISGLDWHNTHPLPWQVAAYSIVVAFGIFAVLHTVLWQRYKNDRRYDARVVRIARPNDKTAIINVELGEIFKRGRPRDYHYTAGQYSYLGVPGSGSRPHPFTMTSIPNIVGRSGPTVNVGVDSRMRTEGIAWDRTIEYCVKASGAGTTWLVDNLEEGQQVTVSTPRGGTHPARGGKRQLWVAGGIGITPFVAWLRDIEAFSGSEFPAEVTLVWSFRGSEKMPYRAFVERCAAEWDWLNLVEVDTEQTDRITPAEASTMTFGDTEKFGLFGEDLTVYMCGPTGMCNNFRRYFWGRGVSPHCLYTDSFHMR
ncbi:MAG TPA: hypothetical protein GX530_00595 [Corynebacteriales bacterium]|nr:hypothetical protein [Mycobacteriales bacterium]